MAAVNRVSPCGAIVLGRWRGSLMGNRGRLPHDPRPGPQWTTPAWITCDLEAGAGRNVEKGYTKLFFSDEAAALAAGHRPCAQCRRDAFIRFRNAWALATGRAGARILASEIDAVLGCERRAAKPIVTGAVLATLPSGTFVRGVGEREPALLFDGKLHPWRDGAYGECDPWPREGVFHLLTPPSTVGAIRAGYLPAVPFSDTRPSMAI